MNGLKERFAETPDEILDKFMAIKQHNKAAVGDYVDHFNTLLSSCTNSGNAIPSVLQLKLFIDGLQPALRLKVKDRRPASLADAFSDAQYYAWETGVEENATTDVANLYSEVQCDQQEREYTPPTAYYSSCDEPPNGYEENEDGEDEADDEDDGEASEAWPDAYNMTLFDAAVFMMATTM